MNLVKLSAMVWASLLAPLALAQNPSPNSDLDQAVEKLLSQMTLEEKLGQISQTNHDLKAGGAKLLVEPLAKSQAGSVLNATIRDHTDALQHMAVETSRLKIPLIFGLDVIHGYRTLFPIPLAQSCSWNPELIESAARIAAVEATSEGIRWTFAPMLDLSRDPRWGRIAETLGEDPLLASQLGAAMVRGFQGKDLADPTSMAACGKHFVGYGAVEAGRDYNTTLIPETELRNCYLPAFKAARDAGVRTYMSAFNDLNGVPASGNTFTLRKILRGEWGFTGFVVSDWTSVEEMIPHGYAADGRDAARLGIRGGVDMEMVSTNYRDYGAALLKDGKITQEMIDDSVRRILRVKFELGLFNQPFTDANRPRVSKEPLSEIHLKTARELATQSIVLLKNERDFLPLAPSAKTIAIIGPLADSGDDMRGCWFCESKPSDTITPLAALKATAPGGTRILHAPGLSRDTDIDPKNIAAAVKVARKADVVILCLGEGRDLAGEARSRAFIDLPGAQEKLFDAVADTGKPIVLVVFSGRPLTFAHAAFRARSVFYAWHPGTMAGPALVDLLFGRSIPTAKLTVSFPRTVGQIPVYYNHRNTGRPPQNEDIGIPMGTPQDPKGYFSKFIDVHSTPAYPFGFGLSYTTFAYSNMVITGPDQNGTTTLSATVTNTGKRDGTEIVQLYTHDIAASLTRPVKELKGFQHVPLKAGEKRTVTFTLPSTALGFYDSENKFIVEPGKFEAWIGGSSEAELRGEFTLP